MADVATTTRNSGNNPGGGSGRGSGSSSGSTESRRVQILAAAAEHIAAHGVGDTRIADVAKRADVSSALVIYYFGTRERLLVDALRFSEQNFYDAAEKMLGEVSSLRERISLLIRSTCVPEVAGDVPGAWGLWFDVWAQAFRHDEVAKDRIELDARWRAMIIQIVKEGQADGDAGDLDVHRFALTFSALLDGLSIQVALEDPEIDAELAYEIAMGFAERELGLAEVPAQRKTTRRKTVPRTTKTTASGRKASVPRSR